MVRVAGSRRRRQGTRGGEPDGTRQPVHKIDWGPGLRIYLAKDGLKIIILIGGGTKKRQQQDIDQAVALWDDYKRRKASTQKGGK